MICGICLRIYSQKNTHELNPCNRCVFGDYTFKITITSPWGQWVNFTGQSMVVVLCDNWLCHNDSVININPILTFIICSIRVTNHEVILHAGQPRHFTTDSVYGEMFWVLFYQCCVERVQIILDSNLGICDGTHPILDSKDPRIDVD